VILPLVMVFAFNAMSVRVAGGEDLGNDSWQERYNSLVVGLKAWSGDGIATGLFGLGPGNSSQAVSDLTGMSAVFSMVLAYFYDTGLLGLLGIGWVAQQLIGTWRQARHSAVFGAIAIVWIIGVTLTTCYGQLLPLWVALGWLGCWNAICEAPVAEVAVPNPSRSAVRASRGIRVSPWNSPSLGVGPKERSAS
jgi:hypothetical protein